VLQIDAEFTDRDVASEVALMHPSKGTQKIPHARPSSFDRVGMDFPNAVTIVIAGPFALRMTHPLPLPRRLMIASPVIRTDPTGFYGTGLKMLI
jgi:hypothetical protein